MYLWFSLHLLSPFHIILSRTHIYDTLEQCCPKGMYYIGIEYECSKNYDLVFHSKQYLKSRSEMRQGNVHFIMMHLKHNQETGTHDLPLKGCVIQTLVSSDTSKILAELFLYHERIYGMDWNCFITATWKKRSPHKFLIIFPLSFYQFSHTLFGKRTLERKFVHSQM